MPARTKAVVRNKIRLPLSRATGIGVLRISIHGLHRSVRCLSDTSAVLLYIAEFLTCFSRASKRFARRLHGSVLLHFTAISAHRLHYRGPSSSSLLEPRATRPTIGGDPRAFCIGLPQPCFDFSQALQSVQRSLLSQLAYSDGFYLACLKRAVHSSIAPLAGATWHPSLSFRVVRLTAQLRSFNV